MITNVLHHFYFKVFCFTIMVAIFFDASAFAQIRVENPKRTTERSVEGRVNSRIDQGINKGLDKVEEGIGNIFKKKDKKQKSESGNEERDNNENQQEASEGNQTSTNSSRSNIPLSKTTEPKNLKAYSKFDFVAGEKVVAIEDFSQDAVGDFPAKWNTNASGEVVTLDGQSAKFLQFANNGIFYPEFVKELPENFTMEFDMVVSEDMSTNMTGLKVVFPEIKERKLTFDQDFGTAPQAGVDIHPTSTQEGGSTSVWVFDKANEKILENTNPLAWKANEVNRISIWKQKTRLRIYVNENKIWDIPKAFDNTLKYSMLFATHIFEGTAYLANLRVAVGAPDTRSKLITEGKFSTTGILFDVNSDKIKPESYGVLKELGTVLKENATVKVRIIGHTDSDGEDAKNLDLSKRRAASVKNALQSEFGIEATRMETDGKGESQPAAPNTTSEGKANNRRVEFIKL
ncbi:OmpA family protein [Runella salmonicolor]|uniref:OmpA family protein n=1 Tax=Runella salmonicolor TaxID=2950278 RepID=A0ABT1FQ69_9BACT|nr:OmpA family protein [Runella salmonicolor]MCP1383857.1 OmpA family protein [Runella salmonicolor]